MKIRSSSLRGLALAAVLVTFAVPAFAGGPLAVCDCDQPYLWPNGGADIPWNPDQGDLAILANADAVQFVRDSFQAWEDVASSTASYDEGPALPVDVDITNYLDWLQPAAPDGLSAIVFDDTGEIFEDLFGPGTGVLGFAGPEWLDPSNCTILEGVSFLNGPSFSDLALAANVMVHEFGHYSNLAHTVVNGQILLSASEGSGPGTDIGTFGLPSFIFPNETVETMYPFLFIGIDQLSRTLHADDVAILSTLYPEAGFAASTGSITGSILAPNGTTALTGVNVIARNLADPFFDAVSAISSDFTDDFTPCCPAAGRYTINGLTPGATYAVFVDQILAGGFSTPPAILPGAEEFYNGAGETGDASDDPLDFTGIVAAAGSPNTGIDILFTGPAPGDPLEVGDDGSVQLFMPFPYCVAGQRFESVFVNANGNLTFGAGDGDFTQSVAEHLDGPPRIAGVWADLQPFNPFVGPQGTVSYSQTPASFTVSYDDVPEFGFFGGVGSNTFDISLADNSFRCKLVCGDGDADSDSGTDTDLDGLGFNGGDVLVGYGDLTAENALAGVSGGLFATNGIEPEDDLTSFGDKVVKLQVKNEAAAYEIFEFGELNDLANTSQRYRVGKEFKDRFESNDSATDAAPVNLPFNTVDTKSAYSSIIPAGGDVDFFRFKQELVAGELFSAEILRTQMDTTMGLFRCTGDSDDDGEACQETELVAFNDDIVLGVVFRSKIVTGIPETGTYVLAVSTFPDTDFTGGNSNAVFGQGRYVLEAFTADEITLDLALGDDSSTPVPLAAGFPYQGANFSSVFVNSNGNLTFGAGDGDFTESVGEFLGEEPRIAPLWRDLSPNLGGSVTAVITGTSTTVSWTDVPEFGFPSGIGANSFDVTLDASGDITVDYGALTATFGISGITEGGGAVAGETDLSAGGPYPKTGTTFEEFLGDFDLGGSSVVFDQP